MQTNTFLMNRFQLNSMEKTSGKRIILVDESEMVHAKVVTYQNTHGFRSVQVTLALGSKNPVELTLDLDKDDAIALMDHIQTVNSFAWRTGHPPDAEANETRPVWVKQWPNVNVESQVPVQTQSEI